MPLVFVHGVNVREDQEYCHSQKVRNEYFRRFALDGLVSDPTQVSIENPYWGEHGARLAWNHASLPTGEYETFGAAAGVFDEIVEMSAVELPQDPRRFLVEMAHVSLVEAIDALWSAAAFTNTAEDPEPLTALAWKAAQYAKAFPTPVWLPKVGDDDGFIAALFEAVEKWSPATAPTAPSNQQKIETFGGGDIWNRVKAASGNLIKSVASAAGRGASKVAVSLTRGWTHHQVSLFLGDVFVYLAQRDKSGASAPIIKTVAGSLQNACKARKPGDDKLIIVAHSMGGNISYDILTHFQPRLICDVFVTVGSQVGLFEEYKLFRESKNSIPSPSQRRVPKSANIKRWLNVFDPVDVLGYSTSRIFDESYDFSYSTGAHVIAAHGMYFYRPSFHERLHARLQQADA